MLNNNQNSFINYLYLMCLMVKSRITVHLSRLGRLEYYNIMSISRQQTTPIFQDLFHIKTVSKFTMDTEIINTTGNAT